MEESVNWLKVTYDETDNNKLKDLYIGWSQVYDEEMVDGGYAYNEYVEELIPKYSPDKTSRVLELACGSGYVGKSIHQIGYSNLHGGRLFTRHAGTSRKERHISKSCSDKLKTTNGHDRFR